MRMTGNQLRAARALIGMEQADLAKAAGVSINTIRNMEAQGPMVVRVRLETFHLVRDALALAGVILLEENGAGVGVRLDTLRKDRSVGE